MSGTPTGGAGGAIQTFRTTAVVGSGAVDLILGLAIVGVGVVLAVTEHAAAYKPVGGTLGIMGLLIAAVGAARMSARVEVHETKLRWTWGFSSHELPYGDATEAALIEPGVTQSGGNIGTFVSGGVGAVVAWSIVDAIVGLVAAEPTLGSRTLVIIRRWGAPVHVQPIGTFFGHRPDTPARHVQHAIQLAINQYHQRMGPARLVSEPPPAAPAPQPLPGDWRSVRKYR